MAEDRPGCQVKYSTWNLVVVGGLAALSLGDTVSALRSSPAHPSLWVLVMLIAVALLWGGVRKRNRRPSWLLPRVYLLVAIPSGLALLAAGDPAAIGLGFIWLLIIPPILGGEWLDRWFGAPPRSTLA